MKNATKSSSSHVEGDVIDVMMYWTLGVCIGNVLCLGALVFASRCKKRWLKVRYAITRRRVLGDEENLRHCSRSVDVFGRPCHNTPILYEFHGAVAGLREQGINIQHPVFEVIVPGFQWPELEPISSRAASGACRRRKSARSGHLNSTVEAATSSSVAVSDVVLQRRVKRKRSGYIFGA